MRELLFKNLTSLSKKRKVLCLSEVSRKDGILTTINRSFIYLVKETHQETQTAEAPQFFIVKAHDSRLKEEKFNFKIKGNFYVASNEKIYLVYYCHSLRIRLCEQNSAIYPENS